MDIACTEDDVSQAKDLVALALDQSLFTHHTLSLPRVRRLLRTLPSTDTAAATANGENGFALKTERDVACG